MTIKEITEKTPQELARLLAEKRESMRALRFKVAHDEHKNVRDIRKARLDIARILTTIAQKGKKQ